MSDSSTPGAERAAISAYLAERRETILADWRASASADPALGTAALLDRRGFYDHIPQFLDTLERAMRAQTAPGAARPDGATAALDRAQHRDGVAHGLQRWQQGYQLEEVLIEWGRLHLCLIAELDRYAGQHPTASRQALAEARVVVARACHTGMAESAAEFARLREFEANARVQELQQALAQLREVEKDRAALWQEAAHDLRNDVGAVLQAGSVLAHPQLPAASRDQRTTVFKDNIASLRALLDDLLELSRIEAGREVVNTTSFDAARLVRDLAGLYEPAARNKGLVLHGTGPSELPVSGDPVKVRRIVQNLLVNALKYTDAGGVELRWEASEQPGPRRWMIEVHDTGPGIGPTDAAALSVELVPAIGPHPRANLLPRLGDASRASLALVHSRAAPASEHNAALPASEGLGLSIVKRLCDLMDATLEIRSEVGRGSRFRVLFLADPAVG